MFVLLRQGERHEDYEVLGMYKTQHEIASAANLAVDFDEDNYIDICNLKELNKTMVFCHVLYKNGEPTGLYVASYK